MFIQETMQTEITKSCDVLVCGGGFGGISAALAVVQLMILIGRVDSLPVFYAVENGLILGLTIIFSAILFQEKVSRKTVVGIVLSVISMAMLSL